MSTIPSQKDVFLQKFGHFGRQRKCLQSGRVKNEVWGVLRNRCWIDLWVDPFDYDMRLCRLGVRRLEKEQEGLVSEVSPQIKDLWERVSRLEAEVSELKKNQWAFEPLKERVEIIGGYYPNVNTTGAGIQ